MRITALAGGVGGARFLRGLVHHLRGAYPDEQPQVTVIGNTGDDITLFGLRVCPDLDTILYTLDHDGITALGEGAPIVRYHESAESGCAALNSKLGPGFFREFVNLPAENVLPLPTRLSISGRPP